jgi:hypothetical protein
MQFQYPRVTELIHQSLFLKVMLVEGQNSANVTNESDKTILLLTGIGVRSFQDAPDVYFAPFQGGEKIYEAFT